ncbi:hypothetical protein PsYK624_112590 [Phanerochaete sordida]|uniref:B30.2/SPRY domain-containing protein n=1 Tax=Phanerochaete sordida TaxID=48140 RepID=A0A9P3LH90_9APHY|nr:hypothetical protein PsYK624_112590 [Phanerochaete sordida]
MDKRTRIPPFMRHYLEQAVLDDGLSTPNFVCPPTRWGTVSSHTGRDMALSETALGSFVKGSSGLMTDTVFLDGRSGRSTTEFTTASHVPMRCPLYYFEVDIDAPGNADTRAVVGFAYQHASASNDESYHETSIRRVLSTNPCGDGDVIGCGVCPDENVVLFTKNGKFIGRRLVDLQHADLLRPLLIITASGTSNSLRVRTRANFGQSSFAFDVCAWSAPLWQARRDRFRHSAARLPLEVLATIATFAAEDIVIAAQKAAAAGSASLLRHQLASCHRLSSVCRTWRTIFRTPLPTALFLLHPAHLERFRVPSSCSKKGPCARTFETVYIGTDAADAATQTERPPAVEVVLASGLLRRLPGVRKIVWDDLCQPRAVPPRVRAALPSLLRASLGGLTELRIRNRTLRSFDELMRMLAAFDKLQVLHLENLQCASRATQGKHKTFRGSSSLQELHVQGCVFSLDQVSALLQINLRGNVSTNSTQKLSDCQDERCTIDASDASTAVAVAEALLGSYYRTDVEHFCRDISLSAKLIEEDSGNLKWDLSLQDRAPASWPTKNQKREVLHLSILFAARDSAPANAHAVAVDLYNCYKPRPVTHWPAFDAVLSRLDDLVAALPHCAEFSLRVRDYPTWDEPWLPALSDVMETLRERVRVRMPQSAAKEVVRVEHLGVLGSGRRAEGCRQSVRT